MPRELYGERYGDWLLESAPNADEKQAATDLALFIRDQLPFLDLDETLAWYEATASRLPSHGKALLACNDRFYLLTQLLAREDLKHPWLFDRCREVEADPDGHIDLWARFHGKSSIITTGGIIQEVIRDPEITIAIFSATKLIAKEFLGQIKSEFEANEELKAIFADVLYENPRGKGANGERPAKWSLERGITVRRQGHPKEATIEAHGLIDGQPTGRHFHMHVYDDVVTQDNLSEEQIKKTTSRFEMADNLGTRHGVRKWIAGTRYCTVGTSRVLMADWTHKPIAEVNIGDVIVGWELRDNKRWLKPAKVLNRGCHPEQPIKKFTLSNGRSVTCTADHRWWRGPHGTGPEYAPLGLSPHVRKSAPFKNHKGRDGHIIRLRELLIPIEPSQSRDAAWLAGFYDGEGTFRKNTHHPSGVICLTQTMHNPQLVEETRRVLTRLGFKWSEHWTSADGRERMKHDRCVFSINGGWRERYRFLAEVAPVRRERIAACMFGQMTTEKIKLEKEEDAGTADVHWLETETGNYVIEGFCSSNSFADTYGVILDRGSAKPRIYPATVDGTINGQLVLLAPEHWEKIKRDQGHKTVASQMLLNPIAGNEATFRSVWLRSYEIIPRILNVYILVDPSKGKGQRSDRTAIPVIGYDPAGNWYLLDGVCHRMKLTDRLRFVESFKARWENTPGVQVCKVGWEQYGKDAELEAVEILQRQRDNYFPIEELNTPTTGSHAKNDRIERLEPDIRAGRFYLPAVAHHFDFGPKTGEFSGSCYWSVWSEEDAVNAKRAGKPVSYHVGQIIYRPMLGLTKMMRDHAEQQKFRIVQPLKRKDENGDVYDLTRVFIEEMIRHPFAVHDDLIDAVSRIYDIQPVPPAAFEAAQSTESIEGEGPRGEIVEDDPEDDYSVTGDWRATQAGGLGRRI